jgi:iron complex outermembrane receptor protein
LSKSINSTPAAIQFNEESITNSAPVSSRYLKDGAYLRLNNMALGYTFDTKDKAIGKYISNLRFSITAQNLFVITQYDGYDPEVNADRSINGVLSYGIDQLSYPKSRNFILGLNVNF